MEKLMKKIKFSENEKQSKNYSEIVRNGPRPTNGTTGMPMD
jgi:hypothetical protein